MTILTGPNELPDKYKPFAGRYTEQMAKLTKEGYDLISITEVMERRLKAPVEVIKAWRDLIVDTGDGIAYNTNGDVIISLDAKLLRGIPLTLPLRNSLQLSQEQWYDLERNDDVISLSAEEVREIHQRGYVYREGIWQPENSLVGRVWKHLGRGLNLSQYAQLIGETSETSKNYGVMKINFDQTEKTFPFLRPWHIFGLSTSRLSNASLSYHQSFLIGVKGVKPEDQTETEFEVVEEDEEDGNFDDIKIE
ncbi:hypothetical protein HYV87_00940 [Candidatus Woesearchaeota archaeon]|nr:hypothetical protein [Candidatus Woesearchaeota archaeon]